ncbi:hypothetical protein [Xanthomonas sp. 3075]|uniref:hypothetical protein n=1 Tax=Xanthomonas sp. 3075 TaxID=3035315 RepID=UPI0016074F60|nr:hypothetical protein [Xanthomonas sp. 3075]MBB4129761.1 hypothetical protein [Xanthomonas sp. 3075]
MIPTKPLALTVIGLVCTGQGVWTLLHPDTLAEVNRGGGLYARFGPTGVGVGMLVTGALMLAIGVVWTRYAWPRRP